MGIDKNRFTFSNVENFLCGICQNVARNPVLINDCEHYICRACVPPYIETCPTCGSRFVGWKEIGPALKRVYLNIKLKCCYVSCQEELTIENYESHERACSKGVYQCQQACGFKVHVTSKDEIYHHNCINYLIGETEQLGDTIIQMKATMKGLQKENKELNKKVELLKANNELLQITLDKRRGKYVNIFRIPVLSFISFVAARCAIIFKKGEQFYRCFTCQLRRVSAMCIDCFEASNHNNHKYVLVEAENDRNYCDCGDKETLRKGSTCSQHKL